MTPPHTQIPNIGLDIGLAQIHHHQYTKDNFGEHAVPQAGTRENHGR
jgi:hypothetical protein